LLVLQSTATVAAAAHLGQADEPAREGDAELLQVEASQNAADGGGVGRGVAGEAQGVLEGAPVVGGPALDAGEVDLAAKQAEESQGQHRGEGVADAPELAGVVDLSQGVEQRRQGCGHP
jgi:hypothetical protein